MMSIRQTVTAGVCLTLMGCLAVTHAVTLEVKDGNSTCIKAVLNANFSITYNSTNGTNSVVFALPDSASTDNSTCNGTSQRLVASFGDGHALTLVFSRNGSLYGVTQMSLRYNLSDNSTFPQSNSTDVVTVETNSSRISASMNSTYRCLSSSPVSLNADVTVTFSDVHLEAYMQTGNLSTNESVCSADQTVTTVAPPKTTPAPSPLPTGVPERGNYTITSDNTTACLLAVVGLQLNITYFSTTRNKNVSEVRNLQPNKTSFSGSCGVTVATLILTEDTTNLNFTFTLNSTSQKFHLSAVSVSARWPDMTVVFSAENSSLQYLQGSVGRSYMCNSEQTLAVMSDFSLNTFRLQLQPFNVTRNQFSAAEECRMDQENMLIPIIVGAALAGLVLIVLIAYLIGRKRTRAGYQTI
ncbi:lysosome-associated membrane glycoprotein 1a [Triplophysa dalaica]|uniref:lysosome-associated membrane glycoprotein 1a n=1 Tax=Triplophysa dalaica TaxID=1582913 RepID=UPI0024DF9AB4|nr:lysosome-associated membrane glycoprotein 1a [Triplophysa dalaica]